MTDEVQLHRHLDPVKASFVASLERLREIVEHKRLDLARDEATLAKAEEEFIEMNRK